MSNTFEILIQEEELDTNTAEIRESVTFHNWCEDDDRTHVKNMLAIYYDVKPNKIFDTIDYELAEEPQILGER